MEYNFRDKVVLVTGASIGIGESIAIYFAKYGAKLALVGRNEANLQRVCGVCHELSKQKVVKIVADLGTDEGCETTFKTTMDEFGRLDILINNAGLGARTNIQLTDMACFDKVFSVNVRGVYNLTRLCTPALISSQGNIINISSISGSMTSVGSLPYSMTKAALDHFSNCIALELAPLGVRVNTVSPGLTVSDFVMKMTNYTEEAYQAWVKEFSKSIPMKDACQPEDIAKMVLHLASEHSRLVTGANVVVDGGLKLGGAGNSTIMTQQIKDMKK